MINQSPSTPHALLSQLNKVLQAGEPSTDNISRKEAYRISSLLAASLRTPEEIAFETCFLPAYGACCRAGVQLGLFEAISKSSGHVTATELATITGGERWLIVRLLRVITGLGLVLEVAPETYGRLPATDAMASGMISAAQRHFWDQGVASLLHLPSYLAETGSRSPTDARKGLFQRAFPTSLDAFSYWQSRPPPRHAFDNFNFLMTCVRGTDPAWLSWFPIHEQVLKDAQPGAVILVDIGGNMGHDVLGFKRRVGCSFPANARLVLEDRQAVLEEAGELEAGIEKVAYDFFTPQTIIGARVYYYAHILHDWCDEAAARILRNTKLAMTPGYSKIFLYEFILPDKGCSLLQAGFDIQMMGMHAGMERTQAQWTRLLESEGFRIVRFWMPPDADAEGIIEAELAI